MGQKPPFGVMTAVFLLSQWMCVFSWSQTLTPPGPTPPTQSKPAGVSGPVDQRTALPSPIPAASIASEVEAANLNLFRIRLNLDEAGKFPSVRQQLEVLAASIKLIRLELQSGEKSQDKDLFDLRQQSTLFSIRLNELQQELVPRSQALEKRWEELRRMALLWNIIYQSLAGKYSRNKVPLVR
jgi:hypothetical protein